MIHLLKMHIMAMESHQHYIHNTAMNHLQINYSQGNSIAGLYHRTNGGDL